MALLTVIEASSSSTTIKYTLTSPLLVSLHFNSNSKFIITSSSKHKSLQLLFRSKLTPHFQPLVTSSKRDDVVIYSHTFGINRLHFRSKTASPSSKSDIIESLGEGEGEGEVDGNGDGDGDGDVLDKQTNFARLLQIGQQNLAFGLKFNAKGVVDCFEKDFEVLPYGQRRDIDFKMIEGDFDLFEGTWSIEQSTDGTLEQSQRYRTTLSYTVDVVPKIWLPVQLVEGRLFKEIKMNLFSIREVAQKISDTISAGIYPTIFFATMTVTEIVLALKFIANLICVIYLFSSKS
nr:START-like domain-containing protein [Tanacetum cinerariifolium]